MPIISTVIKTQKILFADVFPVLLFSFSIVINRYITHRQGQTENDQGEKQNREGKNGKNPSSPNKALFYYELFLPSHITRERRKEQRRKAKIPLLAMKKPMYDNCELLDPQGNLLSKISKKKARWYIQKGLGTWIHSDHPNQILLNFEPKSRSSQTYGISKKENICVICGKSENHIRFYIVPYVYRALFPTCYKSHMSHDVVILCGSCHIHCSKYTHIRMKELEATCRPYQGYPPKLIQDPHLYLLRSCAVALKQWRHKMPTEKIKDYEVLVLQYIQSIHGHTQTTNHVTEEYLEQAMNVVYQVENPNYVSASNFVVKKLASNDDQIQVFVREWRQYFVDMNLPKYLPIGWKIDYPVRCDKEP